MKKNIILLSLFFSTILLYGQKHSVGLYLNAIHNFSYLNNNFDSDKTVRQPLYVLRSFGIEYSHNIKNNLGLYSSFSVINIGVRINRTYRARFDGRELMHRRGSALYSQTPSIRLGLVVKHNSINITFGPNIRYIPKVNVGNSSPSVFENESYTPIAELEYNDNKSNLHASLFFNLDFKIAQAYRNEIRLNFISNLGLHSIYTTTSRIENFDNNEVKEIVHNNFGTYLGVGVKIIRSSKNSFKDILNFNRS